MKHVKQQLLALTVALAMMLTSVSISGCEENSTSSEAQVTTDEGESDTNDNSLKSDNEATSQSDNNEGSTVEQTESPNESSNDLQNADVTETEPLINSSNAAGTLNGSGYEGIPGTGKYNYGEALQKSLLFYELQRSGRLPINTRCNWRGDSCIHDGNNEGLDLSGGWFDAGDNVKFNLPMAYSASVLAWSVYETPESYQESGQLSYALNNVKWACDYFIRCHPEDEVYYYQVGNGSQDHSWWGPCEVIEYEMNRPCYKVDSDNPGSAVTGEAAAALALGSIVLEDTDPQFAELCLEHAMSLYAFAEKYKSDAGYTAANGFYDSWSGFYDELSWAGVWLYLATDNSEYLNKAQTYYESAGQDYDWAFCWDDVHIGAAVMLAELTSESKYISAVEQHLDYWVNDITYTPKGLAWLDGWGSLRYATTTAFIAEVYANGSNCETSKQTQYKAFAESQANYALGDTGKSYMIGMGENYPQHPHHRTAQGSYCDNMNEPQNARHVLCGALVGGPDVNDNYTDEVSNFNTNEVACDYNAGFTGLLACLYSDYHGETIKDFGAVEIPTIDEYSCEAAINAEGNGFTELRVIAYNQTAWPARCPDSLEYRYFMDLSEVIEAGFVASDIKISANYVKDATVNGIGVWDEANSIYYLSISFNSDKFYPGGQDEYKKEVQVRMEGPNGVWDSGNDPSYQGLSVGNLTSGINSMLYENGVAVYGTEPGEGGTTAGDLVASADSNNSNPNNSEQNNSDGGVTDSGSHRNTLNSGEISDGDLTVSMTYNNNGTQTNAIAGELRITNTGNEAISLQTLNILYYLTNDDGKSLEFACYHAAVQESNGNYNPIQSVSGVYSETENLENSDTLCTISFGEDMVIPKEAYLVINFSINYSDWSPMNTSNDYSALNAENIVIMSANNVIAGIVPEG